MCLCAKQIRIESKCGHKEPYKPFHKKWCIIFFVLISVEFCLTLLATVQLRSQGLSFRLPWRGREGKKIDPENEADHCEVIRLHNNGKK